VFDYCFEAYQLEIVGTTKETQTKWSVTKRYNDFHELHETVLLVNLHFSALTVLHDTFVNLTLFFQLCKTHKKVQTFTFPAKQLLNRFDPVQFHQPPTPNISCANTIFRIYSRLT
jgi:hypothetical protein